MDLSQFTQSFSYLGLFLISFISSSTIFFPLPVYILVFLSGAIANPWLVALISAAGATIGEGVSYVVGMGGRYVLKGKHEKYFLRGKRWFEQGRGFLIVMIFAATPLPFDIVGILSGALKYNLKRFILATFLGKLISSLTLALSGFYGIKWVLSVFYPAF